MNFAIDIVSDFVCPWCFLGKARIKKAMAMAQEKHPELRFQLNWLPYFLGPDVPQAGQPYRAYLEAKFGGAKPVESAQQRVIEAGAEDGVEYDFARIATFPNTLRAHRLIYRAQSTGHPQAEIQALADRLFVAHFQRGEDIGNISVLADIAAECGDDKDAVTAYLEGAEGESQVKSLVNKIGKLGVSGVPHFILQRHMAVSGAQSATVLAAAIMQAMQLVR